jgi:hypothetical protein
MPQSIAKFRLSFDIPNLDEYLSSNIKSCTNSYEAELTIDDDNNHEIELKIFYDSSEYLGHKIMNWEQQTDLNILLKIKISEIISPVNLLEVDFSNSFFDKSSDGAMDKLRNLTILSFSVKNLRKIHHWPENENSTFYLNDTAFRLIECNYNYIMPWPMSEEKFSWQPQNKTQKQKFGKITFLPEHHFFPKVREGQEIKIKKEHRFTVFKGNQSEKEIKEHIELLCTLYSFYCHEVIAPRVSKIYSEGKLYMEINEVPDKMVDFPHGMFLWDFLLNPLNLVNNVNVDKLLSNLKFTSQIVDRFIYALKISGESKFMVLYSILEQLRNFYVDDTKANSNNICGNNSNVEVREEYQFNCSKTKVDYQIKNVLKSLSEMVIEEEKDEFIKNIASKVPFVKLKSMRDQFASFFSHIGINPSEFEIDFTETQKLRNEIFHGKKVTNKELLDKFNKPKHLPKLTGMVILKYFGIQDLEKIKRQRL